MPSSQPMTTTCSSERTKSTSWILPRLGLLSLINGFIVYAQQSAQDLEPTRNDARCRRP